MCLPNATRARAGANVNAATALGGATPLHRAAYIGHVDILKLLCAPVANMKFAVSRSYLTLWLADCGSVHCDHRATLATRCAASKIQL
jgi:ankyrin repeat protein